MWFRGLKSYSSVLEIRDYANLNRSSKSVSETRKSVKIAIIDNEKFDAHQNLKTYGYDISEFPDISSITEIKPFDVVLCDLMGVGNNFDQAIGGASIIREIKSNYPTKFVIAFTAARANTTEANAAKEIADDFLKKDAEVSKWVEKLDHAIDLATDPYTRWIIARQGLLQSDIDIRKIIELESAYVKSVKKKDKNFSSLTKVAGSSDLTGHAKAIIDGLISSVIYSWIFHR